MDCYHGKSCEQLLLKHSFPSFASFHHAEQALNTDSQLLLYLLDALEVVCIFWPCCPAWDNFYLNLHCFPLLNSSFLTSQVKKTTSFVLWLQVKIGFKEVGLLFIFLFLHIITWKMNPNRKPVIPNHEMSLAKPPSLMDSLMIRESSCIFLEGRRAVWLVGILSKYFKWGMSFFTSAL